MRENGTRAHFWPSVRKIFGPLVAARTTSRDLSMRCAARDLKPPPTPPLSRGAWLNPRLKVRVYTPGAWLRPRHRRPFVTYRLPKFSTATVASCRRSLSSATVARATAARAFLSAPVAVASSAARARHPSTPAAPAPKRPPPLNSGRRPLTPAAPSPEAPPRARRSLGQTAAGTPLLLNHRFL